MSVFIVRFLVIPVLYMNAIQTVYVYTLLKI